MHLFADDSSLFACVEGVEHTPEGPANHNKLGLSMENGL